MKDAEQDVAEDATQDVARNLVFGARAARALLTTHHHRRRRLCASRAEMGAQLGSSVAFGSGCGQAPASGGAAQSASMFIAANRNVSSLEVWALGGTGPVNVY